MDKKDFVIKDEEIKRIKIAKEFREKLDAKEHELSEQNHYRDQYHRLNNQVIDLYNQWRQGIEVYDGKNKLDIKPDLTDPCAIVDVLKKMVKITTSKDLQKYLKKIIVSANLLLRKYFPEHVNERFDADKIYERIHKHIDYLHNELKRYNPKWGEKRNSMDLL